MTEWWQVTLAIIGGALVLINFFNAVKDLIKSSKQPTNSLEERVSLLEKKLEFEIKATFVEYDARFGRDKQKIEAIEDGNRVTQQALLALLNHAIDGNNVDEMNDARKELNKYFIRK